MMGDTKNRLERKRSKIAVIVIVLFHLVGLIGLSMPSSQHFFLDIVPCHILLMLAVILLSQNQADGKILLFFLLVFILGFAAEWLGVHKNLLFGQYSYGETLGLKLWGIPLIIGINWFLLIYSAAVALQRSRVKSQAIRVISGAVLLVLLDWVIEPVATHLDYWHWANDVVPLKNYLCWFLISALLLFIFEKFNFRKQGIAAPVLLLTQFVFFVALYFVNH